MTFVDTNFFLRFLMQDDNAQFKEAKQLFLDGAAGKIELTTSTLVFFEIYWVLKSYYEKEKNDLINLLSKLLGLQFIILEERDVLVESLEYYSKTTLSLEDCYNAAFAKKRNIKEFKTFDVKLGKFFRSQKD